MTQTTSAADLPVPSTPLPPETAGAEKSVTVIFNPVSGQSDPERRKKVISDALAAHGYTSQFIVTTKEQGAKALAEQALKDGVDLLAVSGGDGTVMEALSALVGTDIPAAVFPAGTGNLLSVNLGIPITVPDAVDVALSGRKFHLDLARTSEGRYFAIMGGMGLDAQMIAGADREAKKRLGKLAYVWAAVKNLPRRRSHVDIYLDDKPRLRRRVKSVVVANMGKITGGVDAMPTASPDDGLLDVGILKSATVGQGLRLMGYALLGRAHDDPGLEVHQARRVVLRPRRPQQVEFDGEDAGRMRELAVEIVPRAVQILLPVTAPAVQETHEPPTVVAERTAKRRLLPPLLLLLAAVGLVWAWRQRPPRPNSGEPD